MDFFFYSKLSLIVMICWNFLWENYFVKVCDIYFLIFEIVAFLLRVTKEDFLENLHCTMRAWFSCNACHVRHHQNWKSWNNGRLRSIYPPSELMIGLLLLFFLLSRVFYNPLFCCLDVNWNWWSFVSLVKNHLKRRN